MLRAPGKEDNQLGTGVITIDSELEVFASKSLEPWLCDTNTDDLRDHPDLQGPPITQLQPLQPNGLI